MLVGVLVIELFIPDSGSLKGKRKEVKSIKDRLRSNFNVSVSEIDNQELWQRSSIGVAIAGSDASHLRETMDRIESFVERNWAHLVLEIRGDILSL
ncbi:DUF503 domain-containing protein [Hydrogenivirga sp. 128-5-R1-1]|uniref:DUF503 domain-containing protein n=1 Tax=Hydrogenivirga sp. 128-5-R1-1 TaxID=392423 RepID=UPI00015F0C68|nr:DUF503 domain-containing protein [Hydrogenivirga sp. 128-5-R1-1]EDP75876.1 hypothetical protein HG1285_06105 [Hydrogenivirga sp. 128-5-R1-1]